MTVRVKGWRNPAAVKTRRAALRARGVVVSKYGAVPTVVDGIRFASRREANRYLELKLLEVAGRITNLTLQPAWDLHAPGGATVARYIADFAYYDLTTHQTVVEDAKGVKTAVFRLKAKWIQAEHGITVQCV